MTMSGRKPRFHALAGLALALLIGSGPARAESDWSVMGFAGVMTDEVWEEALQFWDADYLRSGLAGIAVGRDLARWRRLSFGFELQAVKHFGRQTNFELNAPLVARYHRAGRIWPAFTSTAFGFGLSWASEKPQTEIDRDGDSTRTLFYWMAELAFQPGQGDTELVLRLHHRSDGYGVWEVDSGSNALVVGLRRQF